MESPAYWAALEVDGVVDVIRQAARKVARQFDMDQSELEQEARIRVATVADLLECLEEENSLTLGTLQYRLERDLVNIATKEITRRDRNVSYEGRNEWADGAANDKRPAAIVVRNDVSGYTRDLVESLLPAVWDESFCWGSRVENAPDPDMPRGSTNKATGNTLAAHIADIKSGWSKAPLKLNERRAVLLSFGFDWTQQEIAAKLGVSQKSISNWLYSGIGKIVSCLNGDLALMFELCGECESGKCDPHVGEFCSPECEDLARRVA